MNEQRLRTIVEAYVAAYNQFDIPGMLQNLHQDLLFENESRGAIDLRTCGVDAFREQAERARELFASREQRITDWQIDGSVVQIAIVYEGELAVDLPQMELSAGDVLTLRGVTEFHFQDDQVVLLRDRS